MVGTTEGAGVADVSGGDGQTERAIRDARAERMLRWKMLAWFGIFFFASYALTFVMVLGMSSPLIALRTGSFIDWTQLLIFYAIPTLLGVLMLISIFYKPTFHVLAIVVLVLGFLLLMPGALFSWNNMLLMLLLQPFQNFTMFLYDFDWALFVINLVCWLLPFAVYYALIWRRSRPSAPQPH